MIKRPVNEQIRQRRTRGKSRLLRCLLAGSMAFPGCAAMRPIRGIPASQAPMELLGTSREGQRTINLGLLVQTPPGEYRVEAGDILAVYIPGLLGTQTVIGPALGAQVVGEAPPITPAANMIDPPALGYPITVRDNHTLVLPQLPPLNVRGMTLRQVEELVARECRDRKILQEANARILVNLWRPREHRVLVVRQESATEQMTMQMVGMLNPGQSKRGSGHVVRLRAYENDVLHALTGSETTMGGVTGLPGLDAENAIYIIRRNPNRIACPVNESFPAELGASPNPTLPPHLEPSPAIPAPANQLRPPIPQVPYTPDPTPRPDANSRPAPPPMNPGPMAPPAQYTPPPQGDPYTPGRYGTPQNNMPILPQSYQTIRGQSPDRFGFGLSRHSPFSNSRHGSASRGHSIAGESNSTVTQMQGTQSDLYPAYYEQPAGTQVPLEMASSVYNQGAGSYYGGAPTYAAPAPPAMPTGPMTSRYAGMPGSGGATMTPPAGDTPTQVATNYNPYSSPYGAPTMPASPSGNWQPLHNSRAVPSTEPSPASYMPSSPTVYDQTNAYAPTLPDGQFFPTEFGFEDFTIDSPDVIRIPVRLGPGESPNITEEDIILYDGDIVFIESRDSEVFYTGGLLGGGEYMLPRDRDLTVTEAVSVAQARTTGGSTGSLASSGGVSALNSDVSVSPSRVIVRRRLDDGRVVPLEVDLYRARLNPEEDILIQPRDLLLLEYTCGEATLAFIERHLLAGALFGVAAAQVTSGNR